MDDLFNINDLDIFTRAQQGVEMPVLHPATRTVVVSGGKQWTITLCGRASDAHRQALRVIEMQRAERAARGEAITPEQAERDNTEMLVACTKGWTPFALDGEVFEFSLANARRLWADRRFGWLREQAVRFINDDANFLPTSSAS